MTWFGRGLWAVAAIFLVAVDGQQSGWRENQVNATMCAWRALRAATINDTVYLDGGFLYWRPGMADGSLGAQSQDNNPLGIMYTLNFSQAFDTNTNMSEILGIHPKVPEGNAATNFAPNYYDGAMLANDHEFYLYGGLLRRESSFTPPDGDEVQGYRASQYGAEKGIFFPGFFDDALPEDMTRYVTYGGGASAPSEQKGWYFGGLRSPSGGPIFYPSGNASLNPTNVSNTLITLDMTEQMEETWLNDTLPDSIQSRANPELVWVPVGEQGILVVLGGVTYPDYNNPTLNSMNQAQSELDSPGFMSTIDVYDVASGNWYQQSTVDSPPQLTLGCAVVATAQDYSSYNIYYYGGYDGLESAGDYNDDVWVLSLPSFTWTRVTTGDRNHARMGHKCVKPYPDQMMAIGGAARPQGSGPGCVDGGIVQVYNLTEARWMDSYDPTVWNNYGVPTAVQEVIGGGYTGGATASTPSPSGWDDEDLAAVFATRYDTSRITIHYPYNPEDTSDNTRENVDTGGGGGGVPSWVAPVLGVVLGLVFITAIAVAILLYRRRRLFKKHGTNQEGTTDDGGHRVLSWIRGQASEKAPTVITEDTPLPFDIDSRTTTTDPLGRPQEPPGNVPEMPATPLVELMDTSRAELSSPDVETTNSAFPTQPYSVHNAFEMSTPGDRTTVIARPASQEYATPLVPEQVGAAQVHRSRGLDSPSLPSVGGSGSGSGAAGAGSAYPSAAGTPAPPATATAAAAAEPTTPQRNAVVSGVSTLTERDQGHLRNMSDATVSTTSAMAPPSPQLRALSISLPPAGADRTLSPTLPVSPPTAEERNGLDYLTLQEPSRRRSVFTENKEDMEEHK
jgi:hypothetical protein